MQDMDVLKQVCKLNGVNNLEELVLKSVMEYQSNSDSWFIDINEEGK